MKMERIRIQDLSGGLISDVAWDMLDLKYASFIRNYLLDEKQGNLIGRYGYYTLNENLPVERITNAYRYILTDGSERYIVAGVAQNYTRIYVSAFADFSNYIELDCLLNPDIVPYFCNFENYIYISNGFDPIYRSSGSLTSGAAAEMTEIPICRILIIHHSRLWAIGLKGDTSAVQFQKITDNAGAYIPADQAAAWAELDKRWAHKDDGGQLTGAVVYNQQLHLFKEDKIFRVVGSTGETYQIQLWTDRLGTSFHRAIKEIEGRLYFPNREGIWRLDGNGYDLVTKDNKTFYKDTVLNNQYLISTKISENADWENGEKYSDNCIIAGGKIYPAIYGSNRDYTEEFTLNGDTEQRSAVLTAKETTINNAFFNTAFPGFVRVIGSQSECLPQTDNGIYNAAGGEYVGSRLWGPNDRNWQYAGLIPQVNTPYSFKNQGVFIDSIAYDFNMGPDHEDAGHDGSLSVKIEYSDSAGAWHTLFNEYRLGNYSSDGGYDFSGTWTIGAWVTQFRVGAHIDHRKHESRIRIRSLLAAARKPTGTIQAYKALNTADSDYNDLLGRDELVSDFEYAGADGWVDAIAAQAGAAVNSYRTHISGGNIYFELQDFIADCQSFPVYKNVFEPVFWISKVSARLGEQYGSFRAIGSGLIRYYIRGADTAADVLTETWTLINNADSISSVLGSNYDYYQIGIVMIDSAAEISEIVIESLNNVGEDTSDYQGNPFAFVLENRYCFYVPYQSSNNNFALVIDRNEALTVFDVQPFGAIIQAGEDEFYAYAAATSKIYRYWAGGMDDGEKINYQWQSVYIRGEDTLLDHALVEARVLHQVVSETTTDILTTYPYGDIDEFEEKIDPAAFGNRAWPGFLEYQDKLWIIAGSYRTGERTDMYSSSDGETWTLEGTVDFQGRHAAEFVVVGDYIYMTGGYTLVNGIEGGNGYKRAVWRFDGTSWTNLGNATFAARNHFVFLYFDSKLWVIGGYNHVGGTTYKNDVWSSPDGITWTEETAAAGFAGRYGHRGVVFDGKMYIMGGADATQEYNDVWSSADGITWVEESAAAVSPFSARYDFDAVVHDDKIWIFAGGTLLSGFFNDAWYSSDGIDWTRFIAAITGFETRRGLRAAAFINKIFVTCGLDALATTYYRDVWHSTLTGISEIKTEIITIDDSSMSIKFLYRYDEDPIWLYQKMDWEYDEKTSVYKVNINQFRYGKFPMIGFENLTKNRRPNIHAIELLMDQVENY